MENKLPDRKQIRLPKHNYSAPGAYFITICAHNRKNVLSRVVGEGSPLPENYSVDLLPCGRIVDTMIGIIPDKYNDVSVDRYVIMPNHIHLLLSKKSNYGRGDPSPTVGTKCDYGRGDPSPTVATKCDYGRGDPSPTVATKCDCGRGDPSPAVGTNIIDVIAWLKFQCSKEINRAEATVGNKIFQRSFYDHVIRNRQDYDEAVRYISENPLKWKCDEMYFEE